MSTRRVGLVFGGRSVEHEISLISARSVATALAEAGHEPVPLAVSDQGRWLDPEASGRWLRGSAARVVAAADADGAGVLLDLGRGGLTLHDAAGRRPLSVDVLFPLIHGWGGEDGRLQGALELAGVPYVGAGVLGSALGMDKPMAKWVLQAQGIPVVPWTTLTREAWKRDGEASVAGLAERIDCPCFVKPACGGSSIGVTRVEEAAALAPALAAALELDRVAMVEPAVAAREIECAVLGNHRPQASGLGEIVPGAAFYDYAAKYVNGTSVLKIPAPLDDELADRMRRTALDAYRALGLRGFARVDFLLDRATGDHYVNEVNTLPGFTPISMFPKLWQAAGVSYPQLVSRLVDLALDARGD